ncbi:MAG: hypothetical protein ACRBFS_26075 [Aureispira sp.]
MKHLKILFFLFLPFLSFGQDKFDYSVSEPYKVIDSPEKFYLSSSKNGIVLGFKRVGKDIWLQRFDANAMKEVERKKVSDMPSGFVLEHIRWFGERAYCYFSLWDRANQTEQLYYREIAPESCSFKGKSKRLIAVQGKLTGAPIMQIAFWSVGTIDKFSFLTSHDESKLLIQCRRKPVKRNDAINNDIIGMYVFDQDHNQLSGNEIKMPYTEQAMDNLDYHLDSEGIPYLLARVRSDGSHKNYKGIGAGKTINHHIELLKFDIPAGNIKVTKLDAKGYLLKDVWLYDGPQNNMICAGFYTQIKPGMSWFDADGICLFEMQNTGSINKKNFYEIPLEVINQYQKAGAQRRNENKDKKGKAQFEDLDMKRFIVQDDNSIVLIGEQFYIKEHSSNGRVYYTYHYEDMLITKIDPTGTLAWMKKLPKRQASGNPRGGVSFKYLAIKGKHYVVFLDNVKNMTLGLNKRPAVHIDGKGGFLTAYGVDDTTGKVGKISIFDSRNVQGIKIKQFSTYRMLQCSQDEFILEAYKGQKEDVMIKIKIQ